MLGATFTMRVANGNTAAFHRRSASDVDLGARPAPRVLRTSATATLTSASSGSTSKPCDPRTSTPGECWRMPSCRWVEKAEAPAHGGGGMVPRAPAPGALDPSSSNALTATRSLLRPRPKRGKYPTPALTHPMTAGTSDTQRGMGAQLQQRLCPDLALHLWRSWVSAMVH